MGRPPEQPEHEGVDAKRTVVPAEPGAEGPETRQSSLSAIVMRGVRLAGLGYVLTQLITFAAYFALAKLITPRDFGHFAAGVLIAGIGTLIGDSGMAAAVIQRRDRHEEVAATAFFSTLATGILATLAALAAAPLLGLFFHSSEVGAIAAVMSGWLLLRMVSVVPIALLQRRMSFMRRVIVDPLAAIAYLAAAVIAGESGMGAWTLVVATYASAVVTAAAGWLFAGWVPRPRFASREVWRELVKYGRPVVASEFIRRAVDEVPVAGIGRFLGAASLGQFTYATRVATQPLGAVVESVSYVLLPSLARIASERERLQAAVLRAVRAVWAIAAPTGLILFSLGLPAMTTVFGHRWHEAGFALMALGVHCTARSLDSLASETWKATGDVHHLPRMHGLSLGLTVVLVAAAIPLGLVPVCGAISLTSVCVALYALWGIREAIGLSLRDTWAEIWPSGLAAVTMALGVFALDRGLLHAAEHPVAVSLLVLVVETALGAIAYVALLRLVAPDALVEITQLARPLARRLPPLRWPERLVPNRPAPARRRRRPYRGGYRFEPVSVAIRGLTRPSTLLAGAGFGAAMLVGVLIAHKASLGVAAVVGLAYLPLVLLNLPAGIALWTGLLFFGGIIGGATSGVELLIAVAWIGTSGARRRQTLSTLSHHRGLLAALVLFIVWMVLSMLWAGNRAAAESEIRPWLIVALSVVVVITSISTEREVNWIVVAFIVGAAGAIALALAHNGLAQASTQSLGVNELDPSRLETVASGNDPNYLAAVVVAGLALTAALYVSTKNSAARFGLGVIALILAVGLAAAQSRGGFISAGVMLVAAFVLFPRYRTKMLLGLIPLAAVIAAFLAANPQAAQRITTFASGGDGRTELWTVAGRMFDQHPINGIGIGNFESASARYIREPGNLQRISETIVAAQLVHNEYLQLLAETGVVGLGLYLLVVLACMRSAWRAARLFERLGHEGLATLSRALLTGAIGLLASTTFLSNGDDRRIWLLLALGPVLLGIARRRAARVEISDGAAITVRRNAVLQPAAS